MASRLFALTSDVGKYVTSRDYSPIRPLAKVGSQGLAEQILALFILLPLFTREPKSEAVEGKGRNLIILTVLGLLRVMGL